MFSPTTTEGVEIRGAFRTSGKLENSAPLLHFRECTIFNPLAVVCSGTVTQDGAQRVWALHPACGSGGGRVLAGASGEVGGSPLCLGAAGSGQGPAHATPTVYRSEQSAGQGRAECGIQAPSTSCGAGCPWSPAGSGRWGQQGSSAVVRRGIWMDRQTRAWCSELATLVFLPPCVFQRKSPIKAEK